MKRSRAFGISIAAAVAISACTQVNRDVLMGTTVVDSVPAVMSAPIIPADAFTPLKNAADAHTELCANDGMHPKFPDDADLITKTFCQDVKPSGVMPTPHSLADLLKQLGLDFKDPNGENGVGGNPGFAILGHSSALTARKVATLSPTAFVFTPLGADGKPPSGYVFLAFDPGEQFVEVASQDVALGVVNLYIVFFDQACTHAAGGCTPTDLLTPALVSGWSNLRIYESSTALGNTIADCKQCHAPVDSAPQMLRMQEIAAPFTHWFSASTDGGRALLADFHRAHGTTEDYGPIPAAMIDKSDPAKMAAMITAAGFGKQPNAFASAGIEAEVAMSAPMQPAVNMPRGTSPTWQALYDAAAAGKFIAPPYHDVKVTDDAKLSAAADAYAAWRLGTKAEIPDIRDVFLNDGMRDMGFGAKEGLDGRGLLVQLCQQCHDGTLDQTISRALFSVDHLGQMSRAEKNLAIARLGLADDTRLKMPPVLFRSVSASEVALMVAELQK